MEIKRLLEAEIQSFIKEHEGEDLHHLMLQKKKYAHLPLRDIVEQLGARKKAEKKLPTWYKTDNILYPPVVSVEQSSSEIAAKYKASIFSGNSVLDLTGGFGVDSFFLAKRFNKLSYIEKNKALAQIARHNFNCLQQQNINVFELSAEEFLSSNEQNYDLVFIDPDRRPGDNRVTGFKESKPDLLKLLADLHKISKHILVKASPMMDITTGIAELEQVKMVVIVAINNEVKELLFWLSAQDEGTKIRCVNLSSSGDQIIEFNRIQEQQKFCDYSDIGKFLYEPNAAIMKAGAYSLLCKQFKVKKLHPNTHLYTSQMLVSNFPGRKFKVIGTEAYQKRKVLALLNSSKVNVSVRNFPDTPEQVKKKLSLKDGGQQYLFGYRNVNRALRVTICEKV